MSFRVHKTKLEVFDGSITVLAVDAIVNAANATLAGGGGVDRAIHAAAGPELKAACLRFPELRPGVRCEVGEVRVTPGFNLHAKYVIHTVGPFWTGGQNDEAAQLARCFQSALGEVDSRSLSSVAFPAISAGAFAYPAHEAARIAAHEVVSFARKHDRDLRLIFACIGASMVRHFDRALRAESA
jgi:O-acetyl-ADP-ribose deacetylase